MSAGTSDLALARAVDDLRRGVAVRLVDGSSAIRILPVELARVASLHAFEAASGRPADLLLTAERAATLKLANQRAAATGGPVLVARAPWLDLVACLAAADPARDLETPMKGPFPTRDLGAERRTAEAAIALAKRAALLPALFWAPAPVAVDEESSIEAAAVLGWRRATRLSVVSRAALPLEGGEDGRVVAFRPDDGGPEHLAILFGPLADVPLVRLHSACLTGDVLGSLKCDCGPQLRAAVARLSAEGGILLYLQQEGRGIGLMNKLRAYALQDQGYDTVDANLRLGFLEDERDFDLGSAMLAALGVRRIRLLSNNPLKAEELAAHGVTVEALEAHSFGQSAHNARYLATKRDRQRHRL